MPGQWKVLSRREVFAIPQRISVAVEEVELPDGRRVDDYVQIDMADSAIVFAQTVDDEILCLRLYRHGARSVGLELPSGRVEPAETPLQAAERELLEETGYRASDWRPLGNFFMSTNQRITFMHAFQARAAVKLCEPHSGDLEEATVELITRDQLSAALRRNEMISSASLATLTLAWNT